MFGKPKDDSQNDITVSNQNDLPTDSVSSIVWVPSNNAKLFACSSWDSKIRIYDPSIDNYSAKINLKGGFQTENPILSLSWCQDDVSKIFGGSTDGSVRVFDITSGKDMVVGQHDHSVKGLYYVPNAGIVCSLSFDKTIRFWDLKQPQPIATIPVGHKVYCSDFSFPYLAIGMSDERVAFIDLKNLQSLQNKPLADLESPLGKGSQLTTISFLNDASGVAVGTHDGRANISKFSQDNFGKIKLDTKISFKAKKYDNTPNDKQIQYPVHDMGFSSLKDGFVYTAGGDGSISYWDYLNKERLCTYEYQGAPVTRSKMSHDGQLMAYALGYDWAKGILGYQSSNTKICVHVMKETDYIQKKN